jgi:hypothetical protein
MFASAPAGWYCSSRFQYVAKWCAEDFEQAIANGYRSPGSSADVADNAVEAAQGVGDPLLEGGWTVPLQQNGAVEVDAAINAAAVAILIGAIP